MSHCYEGIPLHKCVNESEKKQIDNEWMWVLGNSNVSVIFFFWRRSGMGMYTKLWRIEDHIKCYFRLWQLGGGFRLSGCVLFYGKEVKHPVCRLKTAYAHAHTHTTDKFVFRITLLGCWAMKCKSRTECVSLLVRECVQHVLRIKWIIYNLISDFIVHVYTMGECVVCGGVDFHMDFKKNYRMIGDGNTNVISIAYYRNECTAWTTLKCISIASSNASFYYIHTHNPKLDGLNMVEINVCSKRICKMEIDEHNRINIIYL